MENPLLSIRNLNVNYNKTPVLRNINLEVKKGEILGIVGESGSGKSTLIKASMGLLDNSLNIDDGSIYYEGKNIVNMKNESLRKLRGAEMGIIFQDCKNALCPVRKIGVQIYESLAQHMKISKREAEKIAFEILEKLNFPDGKRILGSYPFELSGGMNQRVGIMMAMILNPKLIFADEPTSSLDATIQKNVVCEMKNLAENFGVSIVIVTHNIGIVEYIADNVAVMLNGSIVEYGKKTKVITNPENEYTRNLLNSVFKIKRR